MAPQSFRAPTLSSLAGLGLLSLLAACGPSDPTPLGGPYGGTTVLTPGPNNGTDPQTAAERGTSDAGAQEDAALASSSSSSSGASSGSGSSSGSSGGGGSSGSSSGSGGSSGSGSSSGGTTAPTWTDVYDAYLGACKSCHAVMSTASGTYGYLQSLGYVGSASPKLVATGSCLTWYGGNMPPGGATSNPTAVSQMNAWAAAGGLNN